MPRFRDTQEPADFREAFDRFLSTSEAFVRDEYAEKYPTLNPPYLEASWGRRYVKVATVYRGSRHAWCFVDRTTGDVLYAKNWSSPVPGARGTILTTDFQKYGVDIHGAKRLR